MYSSLLQPVAARYPRSATLIVVEMDHEQWLKLHDEWLELHNRAIAGQEEWLERHNRAIAEHDRILEESARFRAEHERKMAVQDERIRRLIRLAVQEARAEQRKRRELQRELDEKITRLSASHLLTEEAIRNLKATVDAFIASLRRGGNGNQT